MEPTLRRNDVQPGHMPRISLDRHSRQGRPVVVIRPGLSTPSDSDDEPPSAPSAALA